MPSKIALSIGVLTAAFGLVNAAPHYEFKSFNGGHNVQSISENKLVDASNLFANVDILKRANWSVCKKYISSYNGGHNVYSVNENKLIDLSDATVDISLLSTDGRKQKTWRKAPRYCLEYIKSYNGGHNVVVDNENKLIDLSGLNLGLDILKRKAPEFEDYNGGHNVESDNQNKLIDASNLFANVDILKRKAPSFSYYNGGHNVESDNQNKLIDASNLFANVDILKRKAPEFEDYNGGHNVESDNQNKLIDVSDLLANVNILKKRKAPEFEYYNGGHNVESTNENKLIDLSDLTALVNVLSKRSLKGYGSKIHARDISESLYRRTNSDEDCTCVKKPKPTPPKQTVTNPPTNGGDCPAPPTDYKPQPPTDYKPQPPQEQKPQPPTDYKPQPPQEQKPQPPTDYKPQPPTENKPEPPKPTKHTCGSDEVYINEGHNVVSKNENKLLDLSNITINISLLENLVGGKKQKTVPADSVCTAKEGCCVSKSVYYYNGGHNVESTNENKGIDLSGLNVDLNIL